MGNCLRSDKALAQSKEQGLVLEENKGMRRITQSNVEAKRVFEDGKKKKMVRFRLTGECDVEEAELSRVDHVEPNSKAGVVRIKVVVTREELEQILNCSNNTELKHSSLEKLVSAMKLRGRRIYEVRTSDNNGSSWRPALESIAEDH